MKKHFSCSRNMTDDVFQCFFMLIFYSMFSPQILVLYKTTLLSALISIPRFQVPNCKILDEISHRYWLDKVR